ncbi:MAG: metalloregulator ArsR/SmtB family transcription factor [Phycisphaerae bacterium]|jgi:ArsR family transcriptional regulator
MDTATKKLYERKAQVIAAAAHPIRLAILDCLRGGELCVCDITARLKAGRPNVSRHLAVMLKAGLVDCRKDGLNVIYSLRACCLPAFLDCTTDMVRQQAREASALLRCMK